MSSLGAGSNSTMVPRATDAHSFKRTRTTAGVVMFNRALSAIIPYRREKSSTPQGDCTSETVDAIQRSQSTPSQCMKLSSPEKECMNLAVGAISRSQSASSQCLKMSTPGKECLNQSVNVPSRSKSAPLQERTCSFAENGFLFPKSAPFQDEKHSTFHKGITIQVNFEQQVKETKESEAKLPRHYTYPLQQNKDEDLNGLFPNKSVRSTNVALPIIKLPTVNSYTLPIGAGFQPSSPLKQDASPLLNDSSDYSLPVISACQPTATNVVKKETFRNKSLAPDFSILADFAVDLANLDSSKKDAFHESKDPDDYSLPMTAAISPDFSVSNRMYGPDSALEEWSPTPSSGYTSYDSDVNVDSQGDSCSDTASEVGENVCFLESTLSPSQQMDSPLGQDASFIPEEKTGTCRSETSEKHAVSSLLTNRISLLGNSLSNGTCESCDADETFYRREDRLRNQSHRKSILPRYDAVSLLTLKSKDGFIDAHCHLDFLFQRQNYDGTYYDYQLLHKDSFPVSYQGCVAVFCNPYSFYKKSMWQKYLAEENVWAAFGCHPHNAEDYCENHEQSLLEALEHSQVRALGEIGLDYSSRNNCSKEIQHKVFRRQLCIALAKKLPLVIHCRDAHNDTLKLMKEVLPRNYKIHLHCFADEWKYASEFLAAFPSLFIGLTNLVTFHSADDVHEVAKNIPLDRLLLETDAPYFVPRACAKGTRWSHPGMAIHVAAQIAKLKNCPLDEVLWWTRKNTNDMYGI